MFRRVDSYYSDQIGQRQIRSAGSELRIKIEVPESGVKDLKPGTVVQDRAKIGRGFHIMKEDVLQHGMTPGCKGCAAANSDGRPLNHSESC